MPQTLSIPMPAQGVNINRPSTFIPKEQTPNALNTRYSNGIIGPRAGLQAYGDDLDELILGMGTFYLLDADQKLVCVTNADIYAYDANAETWSAQSYAGMTNGTINYPVSFAHAATAGGTLTEGWYLVISNGVDPVAVWDGTAAVTALQASTPYHAKQVFTYKDCLFLLAAANATTGEQPNIIVHSAVGTIDNFNFVTGTAAFHYLYDTPGTIQWAAPIGDSWAIYKTDSIVLMTYSGGTSLFRFDTVVRGGGLITPGALAVLENEHIYIGKDNVYRWSGGVPVQIGDSVFKDILANINWDAIEACRCQIHKETDTVIFYIPSTGSTYADRAYVYNYIEGWWTIDQYAGDVTATGLWSGFSGLLYGSLLSDDVPDVDTTNWAMLGEWVAATYYESGTTVISGTKYALCIQTNTGALLDNPTYWTPGELSTIASWPGDNSYSTGDYAEHNGRYFVALDDVTYSTTPYDSPVYDDYMTITYSELLPGEAQDKNLVADSGGQVYLQDIAVTNDGSTAIDQLHETPDFIPDGTEYQGRFIQYLGIEFEAKGSAVTVSYSVDEGDNWTEIGEQALTGDYAFYRLSMSVTGRKIRFKFQNDTVNESFYIRWLGVRIAIRGRY